MAVAPSLRLYTAPISCVCVADICRGGTVVLHLPSFILEDEMRETFRGLMEVQNEAGTAS